MTTEHWYALVAMALVCIGIYGTIVREQLLLKVLALNVCGSGVLLAYTTLAYRSLPLPDPVPHAMVLTGLVITVSASALALGLIVRLHLSQHPPPATEQTRSEDP